jgi:uncharacterized protein YaaQ
MAIVRTGTRITIGAQRGWIRVTRVAFQAFSASTTLLIGVDDTKSPGMTILKRAAPRALIPAGPNIVGSAAGGGFVDVEVGGATVFVLDIEHFERA